MITQPQLDGFVGKSIGEICPNARTSDAETHAAHFVAHVFGYSFGVTCRMMGKGSGPAATLGVQDILAKCSSVGAWSLRPGSLTPCLVFITRAARVNFAAKGQAKMPRTHVGIFAGGFIWHYSNRLHRVVKETPAQFSLYYPPPDNAMFYGSPPPGLPPSMRP